MSIYAISDLHLSFGTNKPMSIFRGWENHADKIRANWKRLVTEEDTVIVGGDLSWGLKIEEARADFAFLDSLPGKKILLKGNHDLWWSTAKKLREFLEENQFSTIDFIFNNTAVVEGHAIAGTRGWFFDDNSGKKVLLREAGRLEASLKAATESGLPVITFLHYPPVYSDSVCREIFDILKKYGITEVYHGHIHGTGKYNAVSEFEGVKLTLTSCDLIDFTPILVV